MAQNVKTVQGLAIASIGVVGGTPIGSAKTIMGVDNTSGAGYLLEEDFEAPGYENVWTEAGTGTLDDVYNTSPAPLVGLFSFRLLVSSQGGNTTAAFTAGGTRYFYAIFHWPTLPIAGKVFARLSDASGNALFRLEIASSNRITLRHGATAATTVSGLSANTTYHIWGRYTAGGGGDGVGSVAFNTTATEPLSGNAFASTSTGTATADAGQIRLGPENNSTFEMIVDKIRVSASSIGDNPA